MSIQSALARFSPYYILFGRQPVIPAVVKDTFTQLLDWATDVDMCLQQLEEQGTLFKCILPMAMESLAIAQHRDQLRYAYTQGGTWRPKVQKFQPGNYVYLPHTPSTTLDVNSNRVILQVVSIGEQSVVELEGSDGRRWKEHIKHLAPCHLPNLDTTIRAQTWVPLVDLPCKICQRTEDEDVMLLCDKCNRGYHMFCLTPPMQEVPADDWYCPSCTH